MSVEAIVEIKQHYSMDVSATATTLADLDAQCFGTEAMTEEEWLQVLSEYAHVYYAKDGNKIIGAAVLKVTPYNLAYLYSTCVLEEYRRKGIGSELLNARIGFAWSQNCFRLQAHTRVGNIASGNLLKKAGFTPKQYITDFYDDFEDAILWESSGRSV